MVTATTFSREVAGAVQAAMDAAGVTHLELATEVGIPRVTLGRRLKGGSPFTVQELADIAAYLHLDPADLLRTAQTAGAA